MTRTLAVIVTSFTIERLRDIGELLDSLAAQTHPVDEIVFVAERSRDLENAVRCHIAHRALTNATVIFNDGTPGLSAARNLGVLKSNSSVVAFLDDDVIAFPDWAHGMLAGFDDPRVIGATGASYPHWEGPGLRWIPKEFYWIFSCSEFVSLDGPSDVRTAWGANMAFRREAFDLRMFSESHGRTKGDRAALKAGPFDDAEFSLDIRRRTGLAIRYTPFARVFHRVYPYRITGRFLRGQSYWQGYSKATYQRLYPQDADLRKLEREMDLLRRVVRCVVPRTLISLPRHPGASARTLLLTAQVLFHVALGYASGKYSPLAALTRRFYS
jgi:glycosyltransferase involved in cell wall biosynthesis